MMNLMYFLEFCCIISLKQGNFKEIKNKVSQSSSLSKPSELCPHTVELHLDVGVYQQICNFKLSFFHFLAWSKPKLNTKIGLHTSTYNKLYDLFEGT